MPTDLLLLAQLVAEAEDVVWSESLTALAVVGDTLAAAGLLACALAVCRRCRRGEGSLRRLAVLTGLLLLGAAVHLATAWFAAPADPRAILATKWVVALAAGSAAVCLFRRVPESAATSAVSNSGLAGKLEELARAQTLPPIAESMFRAFMDRSPALAWVTDEAGTYRYVSPSFQRLHQRYGPLLGRRLDEVFPAELAGRYLADNQQVIVEQKLLEFSEPGQDGAEYQVFKFPLCGEDTSVLVGGVGFDITEQRRVRESLRRQSAVQAALGEAMRVYMESGDWQKTFALLLRCALEQTQSEYGFIGVVIDRQRLRLLGCEGADAARYLSREMRDAAEPGTLRDLEFGRLDPPLPRAVRNGEVVAVEPATDGDGDAPRRGLLAIPILREKQVVGLLGVGRSSGRYDGSAPVQIEQVIQQAGLLCDCYRRGLRETTLEEQLRVSQKMEAVGMLAGGVAHDFNNLLQVIQGYTGIALDAATTTAERRASLEQVRHASERAAQLTQQLLAFGRRQHLQQTDLDLNHVIRDLLRMIRRLIGEQITVDFIPGHELGNVHADRSQIDQVLLNLCLNARDALPQGGRITIETENVLVNGAFRESHPWAKPGRYVLVTVSDNGVGMDRETSARIFEPFFTTKGKDKGTGLGLSVVYGVVKQHEGMVHVYSEPQKGTTFKIYLPIVARAASTVGPKHTPAHPRGTETILLAEDEAMVRDLAQRILSRAGYRVILASDGSEACALFAQHADAIALVILDVVMPQLGGREVYERIAAVRPGLPVIFCSGYAGAALGRESLGPHGGRLLAKPYGADEILTSVRAALDHR